MSRKPDAWMPLFIADYLADTTHLSTEQHGAYMLLLMTAWKRGGSLPDDDGQLASIARLDMPRWRKHSATLRAFFGRQGGDLVQGRLAEEYANAVKANDAQKTNGAKGGRPKGKTQTKPMGFDSLNPRVNPWPNPNHNPNETPSPIPKAIAKAESKTLERQAARFDDFWAVYPNKKGKAEAAATWKRRKLDAIADRIVADVRARLAGDKDWLKDGGRFIPHGSTYVNGSGWEDAIHAPLAPQVEPSRQGQAMRQVMQQFQGHDDDSSGLVLEGNFDRLDERLLAGS